MFTEKVSYNADGIKCIHRFLYCVQNMLRPFLFGGPFLSKSNLTNPGSTHLLPPFFTSPTSPPATYPCTIPYTTHSTSHAPPMQHAMHHPCTAQPAHQPQPHLTSPNQGTLRLHDTAASK